MRSKTRCAALKGMLLATLASITLVFTTTAANADPITDIIALVDYVVASIEAVTWADVAIFALKAAAVIGLSYAVNSIFAPTITPGKPAGAKVNISLGGDVPRSFIVGYYATAGSLVYGATWGTVASVDNAYLTQVIALSDLPISGLLEIWVGSNKCTWVVGQTPGTTQGTPIIEYRDPTSHEDYLWVKYYDGTQSSVDSFLNTQFGSDPKFPWSSGMIGTGVAFVAVTARYSTKFFAGIPTFRFVIQGATLYDPRLDSSVGGSGTQRWTIPATWTYTDNPMVIAYNVFRGISYGGTILWGPQGVTDNRLPLASWFAAMNACDVTTTDDHSNTVKTYRCGIEISADAQPADVIETLCQSCNARIAEVGGIYKPSVGAAPSSVMSFTDSQIVIDATETFDMFPTQASMINGAAATYPEPAEAWSNKDAPLRTNSTYEAADGKRMLASLNYPAVPYSFQVQQLMDSVIEEARKFKKHTIVLGPQAWQLEPLDVVSWTSPRNSYTSKLFRVISIMDTYNLDIVLVLGEVDPADYTFNTSTDYITHTPISQGLTFGLPKPPDLALQLLQQMLAQQEADAEAFIQSVQTMIKTSQQIGKAHAWTLQTLQTQVVDGQSALAIAIQEFGATINVNGVSLSAAIIAETFARVSADAAETSIRTTQDATLQSNINSVSASVVSQTGTLVTAGDATALDVTTLTTTINGHTTTISSHTASINGISAQWGVTITSGNRITGAVRLDSGANNSNFVVVADNFYIFPTGGSDTAMFSVSAGIAKFTIPLVANLIVAANIVAGNIQLAHMDSSSVDTYALVTNSASVSANSTNTSTISANATPTTFTSLTSITPSLIGQPVLVWISIDISNTDPGDHLYGVRIQYNGSNIYTTGNQWVAVKSPNHSIFSIVVPHTPSSGAHTYELFFSGDSTNVKATNSTLSIIESRR